MANIPKRARTRAPRARNSELERAVRAIGGPEATAHLVGISFRTLVYWRQLGRVVQGTHLVRLARLALEQGVTLDLAKLAGDTPALRGRARVSQDTLAVDEPVQQ
jgi:hypothetical protein